MNTLVLSVFFTLMINFISPIFHATPIGKFHIVCATPALLTPNFFFFLQKLKRNFSTSGAL